jgi:hypothetical protein
VENQAWKMLLMTLLSLWQHRFALTTLGMLSSTAIAMALMYGVFLIIDLMAESYFLLFLLSVIVMLPPEHLVEPVNRFTGHPNYSHIEELLVTGGTQHNEDLADEREEEQDDESTTTTTVTTMREVWTTNQSALAISTSAKSLSTTGPISRKESMDSSSSFSPGAEQSWRPFSSSAGQAEESKVEPDDDGDDGYGINIFTRAPHGKSFDATFLSLPSQASELRRRRALQEWSPLDPSPVEPKSPALIQSPPHALLWAAPKK